LKREKKSVEKREQASGASFRRESRQFAMPVGKIVAQKNNVYE
jgi:hypothetical protein